MTRTTTFVVRLLLLLALSNVIIAGTRRDYGERDGNSEQHLDVALLPRDLCSTICYETATANDARVAGVRRFFTKIDAPVSQFASLFVQVSDDNRLDWRLLPALAFIESTGGKHPSKRGHNNIFGWDSGKARFRTVEDSICSVGHSLSTGLYQNKTTAQKLRIYNKHAHYARHARQVMAKITLDVSAISGIIEVHSNEKINHHQTRKAKPGRNQRSHSPQGKKRRKGRTRKR